MGNNRRRIASLALFRNLYNEGRSDVMTILCEFAKNIVYTKHLNSITPTQIRSELKTEFEFNIPEYVVESVIRKFCRKENSIYYPIEGYISEVVSREEIERIEQSHNIVIERLIAYIEGKKESKLSDEEKERLFQSFCRFIIEESDVEFSQYISTFIIDAQNNAELSTLIQTIKEGVILYTGIQYNDAVNEVGSWKDKFTIYVEQEILFHLAGYNGTLFQQLYLDFRELVREINRNEGKQIIKIRYFDSVKNEIDRFFKIAERIVDGKETLNYSNVAMSEIVRGCEHKSDVIAKKASFFNLLKTEQIEEEETENLNIGGSSDYHIDSEDNEIQLTKDLPERDIKWSLRLLNYTSLSRKGKMSGFEKSRCVLLTGNSTTMAIAFHPLIKQNGEVPLATTLDYITNKLWFKMNKGFGSNVYPKSFSILTKAQIVLSTQIIGSVANEFEKIKKEIADKSKSEEVIIAELAELKTKVRKPEDVNESEIDEILSTISMVDTERYLREREMERLAADRQKEENKKLLQEVERTKSEKEEINEKVKDIIQQKKEADNYYKQCLVESNNKTLEQINNQIDEIEKRKVNADFKIEKRIRIIKWIPWTVYIIYIIVIALLTYLYGWEKMGFITWVIPLAITSVPYFAIAIGIKSFNLQDLINKNYRKYYQNKVYIQYNVDLSKFKALKSQKREVEETISSLYVQ